MQDGKYFIYYAYTNHGNGFVSSSGWLFLQMCGVDD